MDYTNVTIEVPTGVLELAEKILIGLHHSPTCSSFTKLMQPPTTVILIENIPWGDVTEELSELEKFGIPYSCSVEPEINIPETHYHLRFSDDGEAIKKEFIGSEHHLDLDLVQKIIDGKEDEIKCSLQELIESKAKPDW